MQTVIFLSLFFTLFTLISGFEILRTYRFLTQSRETIVECLPTTQTQWLGLASITVALLILVFMTAAIYVILHLPVGV